MYTNKTVLSFNCGFARTAVRELTIGKSLFGFHDFQGRQEKFIELFDIPSFKLPENYFERNGPKLSKFETHCNEINSYFNKKWKSPDFRTNYLTTFSIVKWTDLPTDKKETHTLANCVSCYHSAREQQASFPQKPIYTPPDPTQEAITSSIEQLRTVL